MTTRVKPYITTMPMRLDAGWNQVVVNLNDYVKRGYGTNYSETCRVTVHANCRIRRIYFTDRLYSEDELPAEFKLFLPVSFLLLLLFVYKSKDFLIFFLICRLTRFKIIWEKEFDLLLC